MEIYSSDDEIPCKRERFAGIEDYLAPTEMTCQRTVPIPVFFYTQRNTTQRHRVFEYIKRTENEKSRLLLNEHWMRSVFYYKRELEINKKRVEKDNDRWVQHVLANKSLDGQKVAQNKNKVVKKTLSQPIGKSKRESSAVLELSDDDDDDNNNNDDDHAENDGVSDENDDSGSYADSDDSKDDDWSLSAYEAKKEHTVIENIVDKSKNNNKNILQSRCKVNKSIRMIYNKNHMKNRTATTTATEAQGENVKGTKPKTSTSTSSSTTAANKANDGFLKISNCYSLNVNAKLNQSSNLLNNTPNNSEFKSNNNKLKAKVTTTTTTTTTTTIIKNTSKPLAMPALVPISTRTAPPPPPLTQTRESKSLPSKPQNIDTITKSNSNNNSHNNNDWLLQEACSAQNGNVQYKELYGEVIKYLNFLVSKKIQDIDTAMHRESKVVPAPNDDILCIVTWKKFLDAFKDKNVFVWQIKLPDTCFLAVTINNIMPIIAGAIAVENIVYVESDKLPMMARMLVKDISNDDTNHLGVVMQGHAHYWHVKGFLQPDENSACGKPTPESHPLLTRKINLLFTLLIKQRIRRIQQFQSTTTTPPPPLVTSPSPLLLAAAAAPIVQQQQQQQQQQINNNNNNKQIVLPKQEVVPSASPMPLDIDECDRKEMKTPPLQIAPENIAVLNLTPRSFMKRRKRYADIKNLTSTIALQTTPATTTETATASSTTTTTTTIEKKIMHNNFMSKNDSGNAEITMKTNICIRRIKQEDVDELYEPNKKFDNHRWFVVDLYNDFSHLFVPDFQDLVALDRVHRMMQFSKLRNKIVKLQFFKNASYDAFVTPKSMRKLYFGPMTSCIEPPSIVLLQSVDGQLMLRETFQSVHHVKPNPLQCTTAFWMMQLNGDTFFEYDLPKQNKVSDVGATAANKIHSNNQNQVQILIKIDKTNQLRKTIAPPELVALIANNSFSTTKSSTTATTAAVTTTPVLKTTAVATTTTTSAVATTTTTPATATTTTTAKTTNLQILNNNSKATTATTKPSIIIMNPTTATAAPSSAVDSDDDCLIIDEEQCNNSILSQTDPLETSTTSTTTATATTTTTTKATTTTTMFSIQNTENGLQISHNGTTTPSSSSSSTLLPSTSKFINTTAPMFMVLSNNSGIMLPLSPNILTKQNQQQNQQQLQPIQPIQQLQLLPIQPLPTLLQQQQQQQEQPPAQTAILLPISLPTITTTATPPATPTATPPATPTATTTTIATTTKATTTTTAAASSAVAKIIPATTTQITPILAKAITLTTATIIPIIPITSITTIANTIKTTATTSTATTSTATTATLIKRTSILSQLLQPKCKKLKKMNTSKLSALLLDSDNSDDSNENDDKNTNNQIEKLLIVNSEQEHKEPNSSSSSVTTCISNNMVKNKEEEEEEEKATSIENVEKPNENDKIENDNDNVNVNDNVHDNVNDNNHDHDNVNNQNNKDGTDYDNEIQTTIITTELPAVIKENDIKIIQPLKGIIPLGTIKATKTTPQFANNGEQLCYMLKTTLENINFNKKNNTLLNIPSSSTTSTSSAVTTSKTTTTHIGVDKLKAMATKNNVVKPKLVNCQVASKAIKLRPIVMKEAINAGFKPVPGLTAKDINCMNLRIIPSTIIGTTATSMTSTTTTIKPITAKPAPLTGNITNSPMDRNGKYLKNINNMPTSKCENVVGTTIAITATTTATTTTSSSISSTTRTAYLNPSTTTLEELLLARLNTYSKSGSRTSNAGGNMTTMNISKNDNKKSKSNIDKNNDNNNSKQEKTSTPTTAVLAAIIKDPAEPVATEIPIGSIINMQDFNQETMFAVSSPTPQATTTPPPREATPPPPPQTTKSPPKSTTSPKVAPPPSQEIPTITIDDDPIDITETSTIVHPKVRRRPTMANNNFIIGYFTTGSSELPKFPTKRVRETCYVKVPRLGTVTLIGDRNVNTFLNEYVKKIQEFPQEIKDTLPAMWYFCKFSQRCLRRPSVMSSSSNAAKRMKLTKRVPKPTAEPVETIVIDDD